MRREHHHPFGIGFGTLRTSRVINIRFTSGPTGNRMLQFIKHLDINEARLTTELLDKINAALQELNEDGTIKVVNSGIKDGKPKTAIGKGKRTDTPALLRVSFFGPFYADYRVMMIDEGYTYALVGSGSADYLWMLSRTPKLADDAKSVLLAEAKRRGYDTDKLIWVKQN